MWHFILTKSWRERNQSDIRILFFAILIAVLSISFQSGTTQLMYQSLYNESAELIGANAMITSFEPLPAELQTSVIEKNIKVTQGQSFVSMLNQGEQFILVNIESYQQQFPLVGQLKIETQAGSVQSQNMPSAGSIWVEQSVLDQLNGQLGERVNIGAAELMITGIIRDHPIASTRSSFLAPKIYVHFHDIEKMQVTGPGARINYRMLFKGEPEQVAQLKQEADKVQSWQWITAQKGQNILDEAYNIVERYLSLIVALQVILATIAMALSAIHYRRRVQPEYAILRTMGAKHEHILMLYGFHLLSIALIATFLGFALSWIGQHYLIVWVNQRFSIMLPTEGNIAISQTLSILLIMLLGFVIWPIYLLRSISPLALLRRLPLAQHTVLYSGYFVAIVGILGVLLSASLEPSLIVRLYGQLFVLACFAYLAAWLFLHMVAKMSRIMPLSGQLAMNNLQRGQNQTHLQWMLFTSIMMLAIFTQIVRSDFLTSWRNSLPQEAPNFFLININDGDVSRLSSWLKKNDLPHNLYPVIRAKLTRINDVSVDTEGAKKGLRRAINLTWQQNINQGVVIDGPEWQTITNPNAISIEAEFAKKRQLKLGDSLSFSMAGQEVIGEIAQIRSVNWQSFQPNFYVIFKQSALESLPKTWMTSIYATAGERAQVVRLPGQFIGLSIIDIDDILRKMQNIINQATLAVGLVLLLILCIGLLIMYALILISMHERIKESALLQVLGASKGVLLQMLCAEFIMMGLFCGSLGAIFALIISQDIDRYFNIQLQFEHSWVMLGALAGLLLFLPLGLMATRRVLRTSGLLCLREEEGI